MRNQKILKVHLVGHYVTQNIRGVKLGDLLGVGLFDGFFVEDGGVLGGVVGGGGKLLVELGVFEFLKKMRFEGILICVFFIFIKWMVMKLIRLSLANHLTIILYK